MIYRTDFSKEHEGPCFESVLWPLTLNAFSYRKNKGKTALKQRSKLGSVLPQFCLCFVCVLSTLNAPNIEGAKLRFSEVPQMSSQILHKILLIHMISNGITFIPTLTLETEKRKFPTFCLPAISRDPLSASERTICHLKDVFKAITAPLES